MSSSVFATDLGGVVRGGTNIVTGSEKSLQNPDPAADGYLTVPPVFGAWLSLYRIRAKGYKLFAVSRIDFLPNVEFRVKAWLRHHWFNNLIPEDRTYFCEKRHQKRDICKLLKPEFFVDDRLEVLQHLVDIIPHLIAFRPNLEDPKEKSLRHLIDSGRVIKVDKWLQVEDMVAPAKSF